MALGAAFLAVGAMTAQEAPTVTQKWITKQGITADVRCGNGYNGKVYVGNGANIDVIDNGTVTTLFTASGALNKGFAIDDAGNIAVHNGFPTSATNWMNFLLIKADGSESKEITLSAPTDAVYAANRFDLQGRAIGDFFSEDGGIFYIAAQNETYPIPVWISNGEQDELSFATDARFGAANSTAYAQPALPFEEITMDNVADAFYYYTGSAAWEIGYVTEDGEAAYLPLPKDDQLPEGWKKQTQNGFDVFELGGHKYIIRMSGDRTWSSNFLISNEEGDVIFHTEYGEDYDNISAGGNAGYGCGVWARKVSDYKVELYQIFKCGLIEKSFVALYEITIPEPQVEKNVYLAGAIQDWNPAEPIEFVKGEDGLFTYNYVQENQSGFKLSTTKGADWDAFNAGVMGIEGNMIATGNTYTLVPGLNPMDNINIADGNYTFTVDLDAMTLKVEGEAAAFKAPVLYLRGDFNSWGTGDENLLTAGEMTEEGNITYTITRESIEGEFKIADENWGINFGYGAIPGAGTYSVVKDQPNMTLPANLKDLTIKLTINKDNLLEGTLTIAGTLWGNLNAFAYDVKGEMGENDIYNVTFKASEAAAEGEVVVKDENGQTVATQPIEKIVKGENTVAVDLSELAEGKYTWSVRLISMNDNETAAVGFMSPDWSTDDRTTGGVVFIRDTNSPAFGYRVLGIGHAGGFAVYDQEMNMVGEGPWHKGFSKLTASNGSSTTRGDALRNYAVFADWSDKASGYWRLDVLNPAEEPVNMLMSEGATQEGDGTVILNGVEIGSGSPAVAFRGEGENTQMFGFDEDIYANNLVQYNIGEATYITEAPVWVAESKSRFANTNINVIARENGYWVSQVRANIFDANVPAIMYFNNDHELMWTPVDSEEAITEAGAVGCNSGVAVTMDNSMLAFGDYNTMKVHLFLIEWTDENEPVLSYLMSFDQIPAVNGTRMWGQMVFDAANNLMVYERRTGRFVTYVLPGGAMATTPAMAEYEINKTSGIEGVTVGTEEAPVEFFNLQGIRVDAQNLTPGIYLRRQGNNASKVVIR